MMLQSLVRLYDALVENGVLEQQGWQPVKVSYALHITAEGELIGIVPLMVPTMRGKKEVLAPSILNVPAQVKRSSGVAANFLCDNSSYMLGLDTKGKPARSRKCFEACAELHRKLLSGIDHPAARAIIRYFDTWNPDRDSECKPLKSCLEDILGGSNLIFMIGADYAQDIVELRQVWNSAYGEESDSEILPCLVTGQRAPVAKLHPSIKGVKDAQSSGASLVSFNAPAYDSFGKDEGQGLNVPVSQNAAFAYGAALNYLLSDNSHRMQVGDATVVFWAEDAEDAYADCFGSLFSDTVNDKDILAVLENLSLGKPVIWKDIPLSPANHFYILALSPNAARLSVRFFMTDTFGSIAEKMQRHFRRLEIVRPSYETNRTPSLWRLLNETVNQNSREKTPSPQLSGSMLRAILNDTAYPSTLMNHVQMRIRAEHKITSNKAAIIKAYLLKNAAGAAEYDNYKEVLAVELNEKSTYPAYLLGRLFSVLEAIQQSANPSINTTIRDRYFNSACATPGVIFPQLIRLSQAHLKKLSTGLRISYERKITAITSMFDQSYPQRLSLYDQGIFQLGYYHQTQKRFEKKEENENV